MYKKSIFILVLFTLLISSCRSKKEVNCPSFDIEKNDVEKDKKISKYSIVILKDGRRINNKKRRKKSENKLFKKKMY